MQAWADAGFAPADFWSVTPGEYAVILRGARARLRRDQALVYSLAQMVMIGFHHPRKMPKFGVAFPNGAAPRQTADQQLALLRAWAAGKT